MSTPLRRSASAPPTITTRHNRRSDFWTTSACRRSLVQAKDDPLIPFRDLPTIRLSRRNPNLQLIAPRAWRPFGLYFEGEAAFLARRRAVRMVAASPEQTPGQLRLLNQMAQTASFREAASVALDSLRGSKLRSFLTLLGHHSRHHHTDRGDVRHQRHGSLHRRERLQHGLGRVSNCPHGVHRELQSQEVSRDAEEESRS